MNSSHRNRNKRPSLKYRIINSLLVIIFLALCLELTIPSYLTANYRTAIFVPGIRPFEFAIEKVEKSNTHKFYSTHLNMVDKIDSFNKYLIDELNNLVKNPSDICHYAKNKKIPVVRGFLNKISQTYSRNVSIPVTTKSMNSATKSMNSTTKSMNTTNGTNSTNTTVYHYTLKQAKVDHLEYNFMNGGGHGILTYILSWTIPSRQDLYLDPTYLKEVLHINTYYDCVESPRVDKLGGWGQIAGSCYPSTCLYKCSTDLTSLKPETTLPIQNILTDYTATTYGKHCPYRILNNKTVLQKHTEFVRKHTLMDIMTAIDIVPKGGVIDKNGGVISNNGYAFQPLHCVDQINLAKSVKPPSCNSTKKQPYYEEVFVISEPPGFNFYHFFVEKVTRISAYVPLLKARPHIAIHVISGTDKHVPFFLAAHGLKNKVIHGGVRAGIIYFPQGGGCHNAHITAVQMANYHYHKHITEHLFNKTDLDNLKPVIMFIKRTQRRLVNETEILTEIHKLNMDKKYDIVVYDDKKLPSKEDTMRIFYRAKLIVAPHGAGLSNILFSQPGTTILEVHCLGALRLSFFNLSRKLGMRYYGVPTLRLKSLSNRCMKEGLTVDMNEFKPVLNAVFSYL